MEAGWRDFYDFNILYRQQLEVEVLAFTSAQILFQ